VLRNGAAIGLVTVEGSEEGINRILLMMRPSKLAAISRLADARRGFQSGSHAQISPKDTESQLTKN
jgi:hypothetical protein